MTVDMRVFLKENIEFKNSRIHSDILFRCKNYFLNMYVSLICEFCMLSVFHLRETRTKKGY